MERDANSEVETPPEKAFAALGDGTRIEILRALTQADVDALSFSDLRERVGVEDSGQFNYHLGKLLDRFVRKTDDGYTTTYAGHQVVTAILAGTYTESGDFDPIEMDDPCPVCGGSLVTTYEDERVRIDCTECEEFRMAFSLPPGVAEDRSVESLPYVFDRWLRGYVDRIVQGFCSSCYGPTTAAIDRVDDEVEVTYRCDRCGERMHGDPITVVRTHPAAVSFYYDHDIDVREEPTWRLVDPETVHPKDIATVVQEDPLRVRVRLEREGDRLDLILDEDAAVVEVSRASTVD